MESYQKLHKDCSRSIEQDAPIGISKQHTNSKQKLKNSKTIWNLKNNKEIRRTQNENDQELLILELWWVWKKGGSANPLIDGEDED